MTGDCLRSDLRLSEIVQQLNMPQMVKLSCHPGLRDGRGRRDKFSSVARMAFVRAIAAEVEETPGAGYGFRFAGIISAASRKGLGQQRKAS